jgi:pimeloyl-ACP methyl ester carboxylesterase
VLSRTLHARVAVAVVFVVYGLSISSWISRAPAVRDVPHPRPRRQSTVRGNVEVLARFVYEHGNPSVVLVGNSMGELISILLAARTPRLVQGLVLVDPALPEPLRALRSPLDAATLAVHAVPGVAERLRRELRRRIGPRATLDTTLRLCGVYPASLPDDLVQRSVALVGMD